MHKKILDKKQLKLLPFLKNFSKEFGLVGGTAIALYVGHRQSVDFDLFTNKKFINTDIRKVVSASNKKIERVFKDSSEEYSVLIDGVKFTFLCYPFKIKFSKKLDDIIKLPNLATLAAMKAYALGRRAKWKDYVDLYFIIKNHLDIDIIIRKTKQIFSSEFNEKIFRAQLAYFKDIDYTEKIIYTDNSAVDDKIIKKELLKFSLE
ncbi:MAG: nucleotidyl transferase AbiEii/AbiGii toxin family protein [Candidatus Kuenenbacteria bacterium]